MQPGSARRFSRAVCLRIPAEFAGVSWEGCEPEAVAAFGAWVGQHPCGLVLDVGRSIGISRLSLLALKGALQLLPGSRPDLLPSVHPAAAPEYGQSAGELKAFLMELNDHVDVLVIDHEEHWWCSSNAVRP